MLFKDIEKIFYPLRWVRTQLAFSSVLGAKRLLDMPMIVNEDILEEEYDRMEHIGAVLDADKNAVFLKQVTHALSAFRDIKSTLLNLKKGVVLSELELFELKYFAFYYDKWCDLLTKNDAEIFNKEDLKTVFNLLDPDKTGVVSFYIYDSYDSCLSELRRQIKIENNNSVSVEELYVKLEAVEARVREKLTQQLKMFSDSLILALEHISMFDLIVAKVLFAKENKCVRPHFVDYGDSYYEKLDNPYLRYIVEDKKRRYQRIDVRLTYVPTVITGANMSGKTMVLKSIALAQYMVQFGFMAPAEKADIAIVDDVMLLIGDVQNEEKGLSSYGAEILAIGEMVDRVYSDGRYLVLLDEPARTTSPKEGEAIVDAVVDLLAQKGVMSLITTHYSQLKCNCRMLRVRGFKADMCEEQTLNCKNINSFIDYSLDEVDVVDNNGCSEAVLVAKMLGVSKRLIEKIDFK